MALNLSHCVLLKKVQIQMSVLTKEPNFVTGLQVLARQGSFSPAQG